MKARRLRNHVTERRFFQQVDVGSAVRVRGSHHDVRGRNPRLCRDGFPDGGSDGPAQPQDVADHQRNLLRPVIQDEGLAVQLVQDPGGR
jgi:hypothetical protein